MCSITDAIVLVGIGTDAKDIKIIERWCFEDIKVVALGDIWPSKTILNLSSKSVSW